MTSALSAARSALSRVVLVALLLAGALCLLGAVSVDLARAAAAGTVRDGGTAGTGSDRVRTSGSSTAGPRGAAESGPPAVRILLRAAVALAGPAGVPDPETGAGSVAAPLLPSGAAVAAAAPGQDVHAPGPTAGVSDRAPPRPAGT